ncbi:hypothetical protein FI667_g6464, partial [Globisporangium splendens]
MAILQSSLYDSLEVCLKLISTSTWTPRTLQRHFTFNIREHLCVALALWTWGPTWIGKHKTKVIQCWSDSASAVAWTNRLYSRNKLAQETNRATSLDEALFNVRMAASHLPGATNRMADAASLTKRFCDVDTGNSPSIWRRLYTDFSTNFKSTLFPVLIQQVQSYMVTMAVSVHRLAASSMAAAFKVPALTPACLLCRSAKTKLLQMTDVAAAIKRATKEIGRNKDEFERYTHLDEKTTSSIARKMASAVTNSVVVALSINVIAMLYGSNPPKYS